MITNQNQRHIEDEPDQSEGSLTNKPQLSYYFEAYNQMGIHNIMLQDESRMDAYNKALLNPWFQGKRVMDLGSGTGILSYFVSRNNPSHIISIEKAYIYEIQRSIFRKNEINNFTIIGEKIENISEKQTKGKVDALISEWMGYFLLYEGMIHSLIYARNNFLKPGGLMFPNKASMHLAAINSAKIKDLLSFYKSVNGCDMSNLKALLKIDSQVEKVYENEILSNNCQIVQIDLQTSNITFHNQIIVEKKDLDFISYFELQILQDGTVNCLCGWFDVNFDHLQPKVVLDTSPYSQQTHWKQTLFILDTELNVKIDDIIFGNLTLKRSGQGKRDLDVLINLRHESQGILKKSIKQFFKMA